MNPDAESAAEATGASGVTGSAEERTIRRAKLDREKIRSGAERASAQIQGHRAALATKIAEMRKMLVALPIPQWLRGAAAEPPNSSDEEETDDPVSAMERNDSDEWYGDVRIGSGLGNDKGTDGASIEGSDRWGQTLARMPKIAAWVGGGLGALLLSLPSLIGWSGLVQSQVRAMLPAGFHGQLDVGSASLGWFSPTKLNDVTLKGEGGFPLGSIGSIETDQTLLGMLFGGGNGTKLTLNRPDVQMICAEKITNWEYALSNLLKNMPTTGDGAVQVRIQDGILRIQDVLGSGGAGRETIIHGISGLFEKPADPTQPSSFVVDRATIPLEVPKPNGGTELVNGQIHQIKLTMIPDPVTDGIVGAAEGNGTMNRVAARSGLPIRYAMAAPVDLSGGTASGTADTGGEAVAVPPPLPMVYRMVVHGDGIPLAPLAPVLRRLIPGAALEGVCGADFVVEWRTDGDAPVPARFSGVVHGLYTQLGCTAFGADMPYFGEWRYSGNVVYRDGVLICGESAVPATRDAAAMAAVPMTFIWDWGNAAILGSVPLTAMNGVGKYPEEQLADLLAPGTTVAANVKVPELLRNFASSLSVRSDVTAESGEFKLNFASIIEPDSSQRVVNGHLGTSGLRIIQGGQSLEFRDAITADFNAVRRVDCVELKSLTATANFLNLTASGNRRKFNATADFDFETMRKELGRVVDLSNWNLSGSGRSTLDWEWNTDQTFTMKWETTADRFEWHRPGLIEWAEKQVKLTLQSNGSSNGISELLNTASLRLEVQAANMMQGDLPELYTIALAEPFDTGKPGTTPVLKCTGRGDFNRWVKRLRGFEGIQLGGKFDGGLTLRTQKTAAVNPDGTPVVDPATGIALTKNSFAIEGLQFDLENFIFRSNSKSDGTIAQQCGDWNIGTEPAARVRLNGMIYHDRRIHLKEASFLCWNSVADRNAASSIPPVFACGVDLKREMDIRQVGDRWFVDGKLIAGGDVARPWQWFMLPADGTPATTLLSGNLDAGVDCAVRGNSVMEAVFNASVANFMMMDAARKPQYSDPMLSFSGHGSMNITANAFTIDSAKIASQMLEAEGKGAVRQLAATETTAMGTSATGARATMSGFDFAGNVTKYNMGPISTLLSSMSGMPVSIQGTLAGSQPFSIKLPLTRPDAELAGTFSWNTASIGGFDFGPATIRCSTPSPGVIQIDPLQVAVSGGTLLLKPTIGEESWPPPALMQTNMPVAPGTTFDMSLWNPIVSPMVPPLSVAGVGGAAMAGGVTQERVLTLAPGQIVDRIELSTPSGASTGSQSGNAVALLMPFLAGARATGSFSVYVDRAIIPLAAPSQADVRGWVEVHDLNATAGNLLSVIGASGMIGGQRYTANATIPVGQRTIPIRLCGGRIAYLPTSLEITSQPVGTNGSSAGEPQKYTIVTSGSVGFDRTINLLVDMPVPLEWVKNDKFLNKALANQRIQIPLSGTLDHPVPDQTKLDEYWKSLVSGAAQNVIEDQIKNLQNQALGQLGGIFGNIGATTGTAADSSGGTGPAAGGSVMDQLTGAANNALQNAAGNVNQGIQNLFNQGGRTN